jgi:hypothetical protein
MPRIDFLISNDRHHAAMMHPVIEELITQADYHCRVISLCEFRGLDSPPSDDWPAGVESIRIMSAKFRSSPSAGQSIGQGRSHWIRSVIRWLSWQVLLARPIRGWLEQLPDCVVLANDAAFPYGHIVDQLKVKQVPFVLMQEGIRFPLPAAASSREVYGRGGATLIAAWGESSAEYFRGVGAPEASICLTGNPRYDSILSKDWQPEANRLQAEWQIGDRNLLFLSNPIDDQGFCTTREKLALVRSFVAGSAALFAVADFRLIMKLHGREAVEDYRAAIADLPYHDRIIVTNAAPLFPLFKLARAAVVLASTVGLEALLFDLPLGVMAIPGVGFVYDYVSSGAAVGLQLDETLAAQVLALMTNRSAYTEKSESYLKRSLALRGGAARQIALLVSQLVKDKT